MVSLDGGASPCVLQPGATVMICGLKTAPQLNGLAAVCKEWDKARERWLVRLKCGEDKLLKPENLTDRLLPAAAAGESPGGAPAGQRLEAGSSSSSKLPFVAPTDTEKKAAAEEKPAAPARPEGQQRFRGEVRHYCPIKGFGMIRTDKGQSVYLERDEAERCELTQGATITFGLRPGKQGRPEACNVTVLVKGIPQREFVERLAKDKSIDWNKQYIGVVAWFLKETNVPKSLQHKDPGYGYIACDETTKMFGNKEIWAYPAQLAGLKVGDVVSFRVSIDYWWSYPTAHDVKPFNPPGCPAGAARPGNSAGTAQAAASAGPPAESSAPARADDMQPEESQPPCEGTPAATRATDGVPTPAPAYAGDAWAKYRGGIAPPQAAKGELQPHTKLDASKAAKSAKALARRVGAAVATGSLPPPPPPAVRAPAAAPAAGAAAPALTSAASRASGDGKRGGPPEEPPLASVPTPCRGRVSLPRWVSEALAAGEKEAARGAAAGPPPPSSPRGASTAPPAKEVGSLTPQPAEPTTPCDDASAAAAAEPSQESEQVHPRWQQFATPDKTSHWWWCEADNDWFQEDDPGDWVKYLDPGSEKHYWWKSEEKWFWV